MLWADFLERTPPGVTEKIDNLLKKSDSPLKISDVDIQLYCDSEKCKGVRFFHAILVPSITEKKHSSEDVFITYWCRNCQFNTKTYALRIKQLDTESLSGMVTKFGEFPIFGPSVPSRVISLIGPDRELFLRGRRAESQGFGLGAFAYYRRVVENQKGRLIAEIAKVAKRLGASSDVLVRFDRATKETQFSKAVEDVKDVIPQALLVDGHNPLTLLHSALSEGLHAGTEEECLEMATSIRVVLTELAERISIALKDEAELKQALGNLMRRNVKQPKQGHDSD